MRWPLSQDFNETIQDRHNSFSDAELKTGEAAANALGIPMPRSGNFADVYEVRCPNGSHWAVKCFTREVAGLRERYGEIGKYLRRVNLPFMVDFQYLERGIRIRGQWYPILKMQWVEGFVLNEFVRDNLDKQPILNALGQIWLRMGKRLREANLAHCDLQHGNVLFVPGSTANSLAVKPIDFDGMCVPALAGTKTGELGHPAFQHPERLRTGAYNREVDYWYQMAAGRLKGDKLREVHRALDVLAKNGGLQTPWWPFGIYENIKYDGDALRINPPFGIKPREYYRDPIEITAMARSTSTEIRLPKRSPSSLSSRSQSGIVWNSW